MGRGAVIGLSLNLPAWVTAVPLILLAGASGVAIIRQPCLAISASTQFAQSYAATFRLKLSGPGELASSNNRRRPLFNPRPASQSDDADGRYDHCQKRGKRSA